MEKGPASPDRPLYTPGSRRQPECLLDPPPAERLLTLFGVRPVASPWVGDAVYPFCGVLVVCAVGHAEDNRGTNSARPFSPRRPFGGQDRVRRPGGRPSAGRRRPPVAAGTACCAPIRSASVPAG